MTSRHSRSFLEKEGLIKRCPVDFRAVTNLVSRPSTDLRSRPGPARRVVFSCEMSA